jgi:putative ABC transport system ATP-binding protein
MLVWSTPSDAPMTLLPVERLSVVAPAHASAGRPALTVESLGKRVRLPAGELTILEGVAFEIATGDSVAIVGASGSGKSTLLALMAGLDTPSDGRVLLDGAALSTLDEDGRAKVRGEKVGFVFQSFQLLPSLTALENVMLPLELRGDADVDGPAREILRKVGLGERLDHYPRQLSGGEQQRVALARAFVTRPALLFADEPTGNLDTQTGQGIIELLFGLNADAGTTLVLVTHDEHLASRCHRMLRLDGGRLVSA